MRKSPVKWLSDLEYGDLPASERAVAWADSQVGQIEVPRGSNRGAMIDEYQEVAGLGSRGGHPWCAAFVYWCLIRAGVSAARLPRRGQCAAVWRWWEWAVDHDLLVDKPARGRLFFWFDRSSRQGHIGFCLSGRLPLNFRTLEGNSNPEGSREGHQVGKNKRSLRPSSGQTVAGFISLRGL